MREFQKKFLSHSVHLRQLSLRYDEQHLDVVDFKPCNFFEHASCILQKLLPIISDGVETRL